MQSVEILRLAKAADTTSTLEGLAKVGKDGHELLGLRDPNVEATPECPHTVPAGLETRGLRDDEEPPVLGNLCGDESSRAVEEFVVTLGTHTDSEKKTMFLSKHPDPLHRCLEPERSTSGAGCWPWKQKGPRREVPTCCLAD